MPQKYFQNLGVLDTPPARRSSLAETRLYGGTANASGVYTMALTQRAPAEFDAVQITLLGAVSGANTFTAGVAPSAKFNNGWQPVDAADANRAFTAVTFGTTDINSFRNPGGGAANTTVTGTAGSNAGQDLVEGRVISDIVPLASLARTDDPAAPPLLFLRVFGTNLPAVNLATLDAASSNPVKGVFPETYTGYWATTDYTTSTPPGAPTQQWMPSVQVTYFLRGKQVYVIAVAGDSIEQGWVAASAVPQFGGLLNGWGTRLVQKLNAARIPASLVSLAQSGAKARLFHEKALNAVLTGRITHLFIKPWSVNGVADGLAAAQLDVYRCGVIIDRCKKAGIIPVIVHNWAGQGTPSSAIRVFVDAWVASCKASGIAVLDARTTIDAADGTIKPEYLTVNSGGAVVDTTHLNDAGQEAVANLAFNNRVLFKLE